MRLPEAFWEWWVRMIPDPEPRETPAPSAWELTRDFERTVKRLDTLRRPQHRQSRHRRRNG